MTNSTISTLAFIGGLSAVALAIFQVVPVKQALLIGGGLVVIGFITQPPTNTGG